MAAAARFSFGATRLSTTARCASSSRLWPEAIIEASIEIIPGISSVQLLAARHKICLNDIGEPVHITTGRKLSSDGMPAGGASVIVMLDGDLACRNLIGHDLDIYWGACLGTPDEALVSGPLDDVIGEIEKCRADLKTHKGWVMDTYLLRRRGQNQKTEKLTGKYCRPACPSDTGRLRQPACKARSMSS